MTENLENLTREQLISLVQQQQVEINAYRVDPSFGILSRAALEFDPPTQEGVIFIDVDNMHQLNELWRYDIVNVRIREVFQRMRTSDTKAARWFSGDEFAVFLPLKDRDKTAARIRQLFADRGISVTMALTEVYNPGAWRTAVKRAADMVQSSKRNNMRGTIWGGVSVPARLSHL